MDFLSRAAAPFSTFSTFFLWFTFFSGQSHYLGPQQNDCQLDEDLEQIWDVESPCLFEEASRSGGGADRRGCGYVGSFGAVSILISNVGDGVDDAIGSGVRVRALHHLRMGSVNPRKHATESAQFAQKSTHLSFYLSARILQVTSLISTDAIACFVTEMEIAIKT